MIRPLADSPIRERVLVVGGRRELLDEVRRVYPSLDVDAADSFLGGIATLSQQPARAVLAYVDPADAHLDDAVAGLREAAGPNTKLILCCAAEAEPPTRRAARHGADDYVLCPLKTEELDAAIGYARPSAWTEPAELGGLAGDELRCIGSLIAGLDDDPRGLLARVAEAIKTGSGAEWVDVVVEGSSVHAGADGQDARPVLSETLQCGGEALGQISLGPRPDRAYRPDDAERVRHYAQLAARLIDQSRCQRRWRDLAMTDEVSGLPNRRYLMQFLGQVLARARDDRSRVTVLLFDIDDFKCYNDRCGHDAGDDIIRTVGNLFRQHCREHDLVTRYGGDEFAVVFWDAEDRRVSGSSHPGDPLIVLDRFTSALAEQEIESIKPAGARRLTISGGLATYPWDASTPDGLLRLADEALLQAKRAGKNRIFVIGHPELPPQPRDTEQT